MTDPRQLIRDLIERARERANHSPGFPDRLLNEVTDALERTVSRLSEAELRLTICDRALLYANQHMRPLTDWAVGSKWDELLEKAWRHAKGES